MKTSPSKIVLLRSYVFKGLLTLGITTWLAIPVFALTAGDIITQARVLLNDSSADTTRQRFSDAQLLAFVNDGQREANIFTQVLRSSYAVTLVSGTTEYSLPSTFLTPWAVTYAGRKIDQTTFNQLDAESLSWRSASGVPNRYYIYLDVTQKIGFVPAPNSTATGAVVVYYLQQPTELTLTTQTPWNGWSLLSPYQSGLIYYLAYRGYLTMLDTTTAGAYFTEWTLYINSMKEAALKMPDFNPGMTGK